MGLMFFINAARVGVLEVRTRRQQRKIERQAAEITKLLEGKKSLRLLIAELEARSE